jgi:GAF domain
MAPAPNFQDVLDSARRSGSLNECLAGLAAQLAPEFPIHRMVVGLLHPDGERLVLVAVWSVGPTQVRPGAKVRVDSTSFQRAAEAEGAVLMAEGPFESMPLLERFLWTEGIRSAVSMPLRDDGATMGILICASQERGAISPPDSLLFGTIGLLCQDTILQLGRVRLEELLRSESQGR